MTTQEHDNLIQYILEWAKKLKAVNILGGKCSVCGEGKLHLLTFHHVDKSTKEYEMSKILCMRWSILEEELKKCICLCSNCHREFHANDEKTDERRSKERKNNKKILLECIDKCRCEKCGYDKEIKALDFHHIDSDTKLFNVSRKLGMFKFKWEKYDDIPNEIIREVNKCNILCTNCHMDVHFDEEKFKKYKQQIIEKSNNIKEVQEKLSREKVMELFVLGYKQCDIVKHFNCSKGTISDIFKEFSMTSKRNVFDKEKLIEMIKNNCAIDDIIKEVNCSKKTYFTYKKKIYDEKQNTN